MAIGMNPDIANAIPIVLRPTAESGPNVRFAIGVLSALLASIGKV
jgi:hypothetical protein